MKGSIGRKLIIFAGCAGLVCAADVDKSWAAQASVSSTGTVIKALTITAVDPLAFGSFAADAAGGTLVIATDDSLTPSAEIHTITSAHTAASFDLDGQEALTYSISLPATVTLTGPSAATMTAGTFTTALTSGNTITTGVATLPAGGTDTLLVGATLTVGTTQTLGSYSGSLQVTVNYN